MSEQSDRIYLLHPASSSSWGSEAGARLCKLLVDANTGIAQQIIENRTDLLDLLTLEQLEESDDIGLNAVFLAVYYDRPEILRYLKQRGINLTIYCDPMKFGTPMYYAVSLNRRNVISELDRLECYAKNPCDCLNQTPIMHADILGDKGLKEFIIKVSKRKELALILFKKNILRILYRKRYLFKINSSIPLLLRVMRGMLGRKKVKRLREKILKERLKAEKAERRRLGMYVEDDDDDDEDDEMGDNN